MSDISPSEEALRTIACTSCGAEPGSACKSRNGKIYSPPHSSRYTDAYEQGIVPVSAEAMEEYYANKIRNRDEWTEPKHARE